LTANNKLILIVHPDEHNYSSLPGLRKKQLITPYLGEGAKG